MCTVIKRVCKLGAVPWEDIMAGLGYKVCGEKILRFHGKSKCAAQ